LTSSVDDGLLLRLRGLRLLLLLLRLLLRLPVFGGMNVFCVEVHLWTYALRCWNLLDARFLVDLGVLEAWIRVL
jgi:hypothetical protein